VDHNAFIPACKPRAQIITCKEGIETPQSKLLTGPNQFLIVSPEMLASPEEIQLALADAHIDQDALDKEWQGNGSGAIVQGQAVALTVKLGLPLTVAQTTSRLAG